MFHVEQLAARTNLRERSRRSGWRHVCRPRPHQSPCGSNPRCCSSNLHWDSPLSSPTRSARYPSRRETYRPEGTAPRSLLEPRPSGDMRNAMWRRASEPETSPVLHSARAPLRPFSSRNLRPVGTRRRGRQVTYTRRNPSWTLCAASQRPTLGATAAENRRCVTRDPLDPGAPDFRGALACAGPTSPQRPVRARGPASRNHGDPAEGEDA